jgi:OFA family oxalate/formate antiporter-like MFS transporter
MESVQDKKSFFASPWVQLVIGVVCMVMIANLQYGWTFFVPDIQKKFGWDRAWCRSRAGSSTSTVRGL